MPIVEFNNKRIKIDPGADIQDIIEALQKDLDSKVTAAVLNAALAAEKAERVEGDAQVLVKSAITLEEEEEEGHSRCYVLRQGGIKLGEIHIDTILKNAYLEKEDDNTYLVLEFEGQADPIKINVNDLIEVEDPWSQEEIDEIFG